jgi:hypothetical protein
MRAKKVRRRNQGVLWSSRLAPYAKAAAATVRQLTDPMAAFRTRCPFRPVLRPGRLARRAGGGDVGGERGQFGVGPRGERLACPRVKLVFGQPTVREGGLERVDHVLAVGVGRSEMAAARRCSLF